MNKRIKLFSEKLQILRCQDCGREIETASHPNYVMCPNCGGRRFNVISEDKDRISLFESEYEQNLKKCAGKKIDPLEFSRMFIGHADELLDSGLAEKDEDGSITIFPTAFAFEKLFSRLAITISKTMEIEPLNDNKENIINRLEENGNIPTKCVMLLRRAHGFDPTICSDRWAEDSHICPDLRAEFGGQTFPRMGFMKIIQGRYPDAPEDLMDLLSRKGLIDNQGDDQVTILK